MAGFEDEDKDSACSAKVSGPNLHKIADEDLLLRLIEYGINIEEKLFKSK